jgi:hypothetical protein
MKVVVVKPQQPPTFNTPSGISKNTTLTCAGGKVLMPTRRIG